MLLLANLPIQNDAKDLKNDWNADTWVLIWEYFTRAIQWIPAWQGIDGFQKSLRPCALDESSLSIRRVHNIWDNMLVFNRKLGLIAICSVMNQLKMAVLLSDGAGCKCIIQACSHLSIIPWTTCSLSIENQVWLQYVVWQINYRWQHCCLMVQDVDMSYLSKLVLTSQLYLGQHRDFQQ